MDADEAARAVEALLFAAIAPLTAGDLAERLPAGVDIAAAIAEVRRLYAGRGVELAAAAGGWRFQTAADLAWLMEKEGAARELSKAAKETLAIVAYHQPATRAEIEAIRGVRDASGTLASLMQSGLVRLRGRRRSPGRPLTYGTTEQFLEYYGLDSLADLPGAADMRAAGLLGANPPGDFTVPNPAAAPDDEPMESAEGAPLFHRDFLAEDDGA